MFDGEKRIVLEAEMSVIGGILIDPAATLHLALELSPADFYVEDLREAFRVILEKKQADQPVDFVTVLTAVEDTVPDAKMLLAQCLELVPSLGNFPAYVNIVKNEAAKRRIAAELQDMVFGYGYSSAEMLARMRELVEEEQAHDTSYREDQMLYDIAEYRGMMYDTSRAHKISTGYGNLDYLLGELEKQNVTIIGARPAMGKTALACNLATNMVKADKKALIFSLEMPKFQLFNRMGANLASIEHGRIRDNKTTAEEKAQIIAALLELAKSKNFYVFDDVYYIEKIESIIAKSRPDVVFIDYIQLVLSNQNFQKDMDRVSHVSRACKRIAKTYKCNVVALAQLSREVDKRPVKIPVLADLRECGQLEQDADTVLFLYREYAYKKDVPPEPTLLIAAKNRHGETGYLDFRFEGQYQRFLEVERFTSEPPGGDGWQEIDDEIGPWSQEPPPEQTQL